MQISRNTIFTTKNNCFNVNYCSNRNLLNANLSHEFRRIEKREKPEFNGEYVCTR